MAKRPSRRLVVLSSSAIAAIYLTGFLRTQTADSALSGGRTAEAASAAPPRPLVSSAPTRGGVQLSVRGRPPSAAVPGNSAPTAPPITAGSAAPNAAGAAYHDGTFSGRGTGRFGDVSVAVTIQGGRIANVAVTQVTTKYPASRIAGLPAQVIARQSAQVDRVTGATASARAFQDAVVQALARAQVPGSAPPPEVAPIVPSSPGPSRRERRERL